MTRIIEVQDLVKIYRDGTRAIDGASFHVDEGEFFGFLGPNGAGKTTAIKILITLLRKSSGRVRVAGFDLDQDPAAIRRIVGYQGQELGIDEDLTAKENMTLAGRVYGMRRADIAPRSKELLDLVALSEAADRPAQFFSGGMKKRLELATALMHRPRLLVLDEPTTGLDPQARLAIWKYLAELNRDHGIGILLTTQYMEEADRLCDRLAFIDKGRIVTEGTPSALKGEVGADLVTVSFGTGDGASDPGLYARAETALKALSAVMGTIPTDDGIQVQVKDGAEVLPEILRAVDGARVPVASITHSAPSLDDVFLKYTGTRIRPEAPKRIGTRAGFARMRGRRR